MKLPDKIFRIVSPLILGFIIIFVSLLIYWQYWPYKTMDAKFILITPQVKAGERVEYEFEYCKFTDLSAVIVKQIINDTVVHLTPITSNQAKGCGNMIASAKTPEYLPPGKYKLRITTIYKMNPVREISVSSETEEFEIIE